MLAGIVVDFIPFFISRRAVIPLVKKNEFGIFVIVTALVVPNALEAVNNATVSQVFEVYWDIRKQEISPSSVYREKGQFNSFLNDFEFGNKKIKSVSSIELQKFVNFFDKPTTR